MTSIIAMAGKGGTGKTTVATNLAVSLETGVQILDCDVEEPNSHLFIQPTIEQVETITTPVPEVDMDKGIGFKYFVRIGSMPDVDFGDIINYLGENGPQMCCRYQGHCPP